MAKLRGGIDLGGTKIQTAIVDGAGKVLGEARQPTPTAGGPADVAEAMATALREAAADGGGRALRASRGSASARRATPTRRPASSRAPATCPAGTAASRSAKPSPRRSGRRSRSATTSRSRPKPSSTSARRASSRACSASSGEPASAAASILDGKPWLGRGAAGEIGHMVVKRGGAKCPCGRKGCLEAYAGRGRDGSRGQAPALRGRQDRPLQADGKTRERATHQRDLAARPRPRRPPRRKADRTRDRGARHRDRLGRQPDRPRGGRPRRRPRDPVRDPADGPADEGDGQAPLRRRAAAGGAGRLARRPRRGDRRLAARAGR